MDLIEVHRDSFDDLPWRSGRARSLSVRRENHQEDPSQLSRHPGTEKETALVWGHPAQCGRNAVYGTVHKMFEDFVADELIPRSPCRIKREDLPPDIDRDQEWRDQAVFTVEEVEMLLSDDRIPEQRRVYYALSFLAGLRHGAVAGLRMRHIDTTTQPLQKLLIAFSYGGRTKTKATRTVPVHPVLAAMLAEWKLSGFRRWTGRQWNAEDFVVPGPVARSRAPERGDAAVMLTRHTAYKRFVNTDLPTLGLRHRRVHDARRTVVSIARSNGVRAEVLRDITHAPARTVFDMYTSFSWEAKCEAVLCIKVLRDRANRVTEA